jgi:hypothetical protein
VRDYVEAVDCEQCDLAAVRIFTPPLMVKAQQDCHYTSPIDGKPITSHAARREDMARHGCIEYDPEMKKDAVRWKREATEKFEAGIDQTVGEEIAKMPSAKRQQLIKEVVGHGVTAEVVRG